MTWGTDHDQDHWRSLKEGLQEGPDQDQGQQKFPNCMEKTEPVQILLPNIGMWTAFSNSHYNNKLSANSNWNGLICLKDFWPD